MTCLWQTWAVSPYQLLESWLAPKQVKVTMTKSWCDGIWSASAPMNLLFRTQCSEKVSVLTFSWLVSETSNAHSSPVWEVSLVLGSNPGHVVFLALVDDNVRETSQLVVLRSVEKIPCLALVSDSQELNLDSTVWCNRELSFFSRAESWPEIYMKKTWREVYWNARHCLYSLDKLRA